MTAVRAPGRSWSIRAAAAVVLAGGLAVVGALGGAQTASAHDYLVSTNPAADSTVTESLTEVSLTFNEPPLADASAAIAIELHDPSGANVASGSVSIVNSTLSVQVTPTVQGAYTVLWQNVSADGHAVSGEFGFDYAGPPAVGGSAPATTGAGDPSPTASAPAPGPSVPAAPATSVETGAATDAGGGLQLPLVLVGLGTALGVVVVVAVVLVVVVRRRARSGG